MINIETLMMLMFIHFCGDSCLQPSSNYAVFKESPPKKVASDATVSSFLYALPYIGLGISLFSMMFFIYFITRVPLYLIVIRFKDDCFDEHSIIFIRNISQFICVTFLLFVYTLGDYIRLDPVNWSKLFN